MCLNFHVMTNLQDINECELYDDGEEDDDEEAENVPKATFCSHTCSNLIGLLSRLNHECVYLSNLL